MHLRPLQEKDAPLMFEWMKDEDVTAYMEKDFAGKSLSDCEAFIAAACVPPSEDAYAAPHEKTHEPCGRPAENQAESRYAGTDRAYDLHMAIADENGEYMGTVSLKHIGAKIPAVIRDSEASGDAFRSVFGTLGLKCDASYGDTGLFENVCEKVDIRAAEFAIAVRKKAMGKGFASYAMNEILKKGFEEMGLDLIYWNVRNENKRAVRFYDRNGFKKLALTNTGGGGWYRKHCRLPVPRVTCGTGSPRRNLRRTALSLLNISAAFSPRIYAERALLFGIEKAVVS